MDKKQQFLDAEQKAQELTKTLTALLVEVESYKNASQSLDKAKNEIITLISALRKGAIDNQDLIQRLKDLDGSELIVKIRRMETRQTEYNLKLFETLEKYTQRIEANLKNIERQNELMGTLKKYMILSVILMILCMVIGAMNLLI